MIHSLIRLGLAIREETRMNIRYHVELSEAERCELTALVGGGKHYARKIKRAQILLAADSGLSDDDIAAAVAVGGSTVYRTKRRFVKGNLEAALNEEPRAGTDRKLTSNEEAPLIATACSSPPEGRARWTLGRADEDALREAKQNFLLSAYPHAVPCATASETWLGRIHSDAAVATGAV